MKVSVIIPVYNEERVIRECLKSLTKQTYKDMEVIVVDDGSTDSTLSVITDLRFKNYDLRIYKQKHVGPGVARNLGAKHASGEILVFVDADMTFDHDFIKELVMPIVVGKSKGTWSREEYVSNNDNIWSQCWGINEGWEKGKRHPKNYPNEQKVFRAILKSEFEKVRGFDSGGHYTDDWSLSEKLGYMATAAPGAKFYHENPGALYEVFSGSKWAAKRKYKLGILGMLGGLVRVSLPISLLVGMIMAITHNQSQFLIFKIVYDTGAFFGILEYMFLGKGEK